MPHLRFDGVELAYGDGRPVLTHLTFDLGPGWTGVVGDNGAGKTTLLRALVGELAPQAGQIHADAGPVAFVRQRVDAPDEAVRGFGADWSKRALRWRDRLDLADDGLERWPSLSEGQRKRWQVAAALCATPDVLVLDEPTNHLDPHARDLLVDALRRFGGLGVVVSHDRVLLDALTDRTLVIADGTSQAYACRYREAKVAYDADRAAKADAHARAKQAARAERAKIQAARQEVLAASHQRSARVRMKSAKDRAAASMGEKHRAAKAEAALSRRASALRTRSGAADDALASLEVQRKKGARIHIQAGASGPRALVRASQEPLVTGARGEVRLVENLEFTLERGHRVHLAGPNGAGKSTLLRLVEARCRGRAVRIAQDRPAAHARATLDDVRALEPAARGQVMQLAAALGADPAALLDERPPTPGQAQKLALAAALGQPFDLVLLDEPTSHLDLPAIERLQDALERFEGTLVLVTHDPELAAVSCNETWRLEQGKLQTRR